MNEQDDRILELALEEILGARGAARAERILARVKGRAPQTRRLWRASLMAAAAMFAVVLALVLRPQDPAEQWVRRLSSERIEERDEASRKLKELGDAALPALRRASRSVDAEVAGRAKDLLRRAFIEPRLTPRLREALPGLADRLADGDGSVWTAAFLEAGRINLQASDLAALLPEALQDFRNQEEAIAAFRIIARRQVTAAGPALAKHLRHPQWIMRVNAAKVLGEIGGDSAVPALQERLRDSGEMNEVRLCVAQSLCLLGERGGAGVLLEARILDLSPWLGTMNRLREPGSWHRLEASELKVGGVTRETFEKASGLKLEFDANAFTPAEGEAALNRALGQVEGRSTALAALTGLNNDTGMDFLLEPDLVRIVRPDTALAFWEKWWRETDGK